MLKKSISSSRSAYGDPDRENELIQELIEMGIQGFDPTADIIQNIPRQKS